jgi:SAM-dependent methyltransferase
MSITRATQSNSTRLAALLEQGAAMASPNEIFRDIDDDFWFWANTEGVRISTALRQILPSLPSSEIQMNFTGASGDATLGEAFAAYKLFKELYEYRGKPLATSNCVLDYGCGWGRLIRFFLKDVEPLNLFGIDCYDEMIQICKRTNKWCGFLTVNPLPPTSLPASMFDLIYCYSVFSHLSESAHQKWLDEFERVLKPGGIFIATTRSRDFIEQCARLRLESNLPEHEAGAAHAFRDLENALNDYDNGKYCHSPVGGGGVLDRSFFGETCIPRSYVMEHWARRFKLIDFIEDRSRCVQNVIAVQKQ